MVMEAAGDRLTVSHEDVVTGMTIDLDRTQGFAASPGTKDHLDEDDLTKVQMYLDPESLEGPPTKMINSVSIAKKLDTLWTDVTRKRATDGWLWKRLNYVCYRNPTMDKTPCPYLILKPTLCMMTPTMNTLTS